MKQNAKFFCESCGAEVPQNARCCRHCGRFFTSVRCPACGETGNPNKFAGGCPKCGYAFTGAAATTRQPRPSRSARRRLLSAIKARLGTSTRTDDSLPRWMYALTGCALFGIVCALLLYFAR